MVAAGSATTREGWQFALGRDGTLGNDTLQAVSAASPRDVWAVGTSFAGPAHGFAEHWNGKSWTVVAMPDQPPPFVSLTGVAAVSAHDAWAVGATTAP